jgi:hypothetical protein
MFYIYFFNIKPDILYYLFLFMMIIGPPLGLIMWGKIGLCGLDRSESELPSLASLAELSDWAKASAIVAKIAKTIKSFILN